MMLYKPSDRTSSDPIEFWYIPESSNNIHIEDPNFKYPQQVPNQTQNTQLKRPKQRAFEGEESTGKISSYSNIGILSKTLLCETKSLF